MPFYAAGINRDLPWYQAIGNHDQFWMGSQFENTKTRKAHIGSAILNLADDPANSDLDSTGDYMGVIDGKTVYGDIFGAGPVADFTTPPAVVPDASRHTLAGLTSTTVNWMSEFFKTTSNPVGHGFTQTNLDQGHACYSFVPESDIPIKFIVLDDTVKDRTRLTTPPALSTISDTNGWSASSTPDRLPINSWIAAHVPILPQSSLTDTTPYPMWPGPEYTDAYVLNMLHQYPNLILWMADTGTSMW